LSDHFPTDNAVAVYTRLTGSSVHLQCLFEIARLAGYLRIIPQRRTPCLNRLSQNFLNGGNQALISMKCHPTCRAAGQDSTSEQRFVSVDITDPNHNPAIHDKVFDRHPTPVRGRKQHPTAKCLVKWLRPEVCQLRRAKRVAPYPEHTAKAARVMEPQYPAIREYQIDVIVFLRRHADWQYPEPTGHT
jgi:hypothetical protein